MFRFKNDKYQKARGGNSRVLDVTCEHCSAHLAFYQKDGPGLLKRMYADRFIDSSPNGEQLLCDSCQRLLGVRIGYKKEDRVAYRLFVGAVNKKVVSRSTLP